MGEYKHVPSEMKGSAEVLAGLVDEYNKKLAEMQALIGHIYSSPAWQDKALKKSFKDTCDGYMKIHNNRSLKLSFNIMKLKEKARCAEDLDSAYIRGGGTV